MFKEVLILASADLFSNNIVGQMLSKWEELGFFSYLLPFMILFALIFGILTKLDIFKDNKAINAIIAVAVALMALQFDFVPRFFSQIFPRLGVGLVIILGILIIAGLFMSKSNNAINYVLLAVGVIIIGVVIYQSAGALGWASTSWWSSNWQMVVGAVFLLLLVAIIVGASTRNPPEYKSILWEPHHKTT